MDSVVTSFTHYWHIWVIVLLLSGLSIQFILQFWLPALRLKRHLMASMNALSAIKERAAGNGNVVELDEIARAAMITPALSHLWTEYTETLHPQYRVDQIGQSLIERWRATALAETFFTEQAIVDTSLKTEFFKHVPGILTGLGIIGTFSGLIMGLSNFDVSDATQAQAELKSLINSVGHAFFVSAGAIGLAMLFTGVEKFLVTNRYRQVEELRQLIDSLFDAGAGEEYLARLVTSSETQATQAAHIKDALVADLKEILTNLTNQQMEAHALHTDQISSSVGQAIAEHLGGPIADIASAVKGVSTNQGDAVNKLLTDVLAGFSAQMQDMFGGQMRGMTDLLKETAEVMKQTADQFGRLAADMDSAGKGTVDAMGEQLSQALTAMEARQQVMNTQMGEFVTQIKELVSESQSESARKLQETLSAVGDQVAGVVAELRKQAEESFESQGHRQARFEQSTGDMVTSLSSQMEGLLAQSVETNRSLQDSVAKLSQATNQAITEMNAGAQTLYVAATDFAKAGDGVSKTMNASSEAVGHIKTAAGSLVTASSATKEVLADYGKTRDSFAGMITELRVVTENAKREAAMSSEIISRIEAATGQLAIAQKQSEEYLKGVNDVLVKVHTSFSENIERTLRDGNRQFQGELRDAVNLVSAAVKDLGDTLDDLPGRR